MEQGDGVYFYWLLPPAKWNIFRHFDPMLPSYAIHSVVIPTELQFWDAVVHDKGYSISFFALDLAVCLTWGSSWCSVFSFWSCVIWHIQLPNPGLVVYMVAPLSQWTQCSSCKRLISCVATAFDEYRFLLVVAVMSVYSGCLLRSLREIMIFVQH